MTKIRYVVEGEVDFAEVKNQRVIGINFPGLAHLGLSVDDALSPAETICLSRYEKDVSIKNIEISGKYLLITMDGNDYMSVPFYGLSLAGFVTSLNVALRQFVKQST